MAIESPIIFFLAGTGRVHSVFFSILFIINKMHFVSNLTKFKDSDRYEVIINIRQLI
jgi:hypothetical protein